MKKSFHYLSLLFLMGLTACTTLSESHSPYLNPNTRWAVMTLTNHSDTPQAGKSASNIIASLLRAKGIHHISHYKPEKAPQRRQISGWARRHHVRYVLMGAVNEWRYKIGLEGEPAVGINLQLLDVEHNHIVWSAVGSKTGNGHQSTSGIAQVLAVQLMKGLR